MFDTWTLLFTCWPFPAFNWVFSLSGDTSKSFSSFNAESFNKSLDNPFASSSASPSFLYSMIFSSYFLIWLSSTCLSTSESFISSVFTSDVLFDSISSSTDSTLSSSSETLFDFSIFVSSSFFWSTKSESSSFNLLSVCSSI